MEEAIFYTLGTPICHQPIVYFGLPLKGRRLVAPDWVLVVERVNKRLNDWSGRLLFRGGRLILVKAMISTILVFYFSMFGSPKNVVLKLEVAHKRYF
jgi:hypothetical protein